MRTQVVMDAEADVATLRFFLAAQETVEYPEALNNFCLAVQRGERAMVQSWPSSAAKYAAQAARCAFKVVPELRGDFR